MSFNRNILNERDSFDYNDEEYIINVNNKNSKNILRNKKRPIVNDYVKRAKSGKIHSSYNKNKYSQKNQENIIEQKEKYNKSHSSIIHHDLDDFEKEMESSSIWKVCNITEKINKENDNNSYYRGNLPVIIKKIETKNLNENKKEKLLDKIKEIRNLEKIKIYDYFEDKDSSKIFILIEDKEVNITKFNNIFYNGEYNIIEEIALEIHGAPVKISKIEEFIEKGKNSICKISIPKKGKASGVFCSIPLRNKEMKVLLTNYHVIDENIIKSGEFEFELRDQKKN